MNQSKLQTFNFKFLFRQRRRECLLDQITEVKRGALRTPATDREFLL